MSTQTPIMDGAKFILEKGENTLSIKFFNGEDITFILTGLSSPKTIIFAEWLAGSAAAFHKIPFEQTVIETIISESESDGPEDSS